MNNEKDLCVVLSIQAQFEQQEHKCLRCHRHIGPNEQVYYILDQTHNEIYCYECGLDKAKEEET